MNTDFLRLVNASIMSSDDQLLTAILWLNSENDLAELIQACISSIFIKVYY